MREGLYLLMAALEALRLLLASCWTLPLWVENSYSQFTIASSTDRSRTITPLATADKVQCRLVELDVTELKGGGVS